MGHPNTLPTLFFMTPVIIVPPIPPIFHPDDARLFAQRCFASRSLKHSISMQTASIEDKGTNAYVNPTTFVILNIKARITMGMNLSRKYGSHILRSYVVKGTYERVNLRNDTMRSTSQRRGKVYSAICKPDQDQTREDGDN